MIDYRLYMSVGGELSEKADLYSLAKNATYFEIETIDGRMLNEDMVDDKPVFRKQWGTLKIKNKPFEYKTDPSTKNKLYETVIENNTTYTYFLKLTYLDKTVYGYFGEVDCKINEDHSIIDVSPAVIDQYTDFIENYEQEVDVFGSDNLIKNGRFEIWTGGNPYGWTAINPHSAYYDILLDKYCAKISAVYGLGQTIPNLSGGNQINLSFLYAFVGDDEVRGDLFFKLKFVGVSSKIYYLQENGSWVESGTQNFVYKPNAYPIPEESIEEFKSFPSFVTQQLPENGSATISFYGVGNNMLYLTDVAFNSSDVQYVDLSINIPVDNMVTKTQEAIGMVNTTFRYYPTFNARVRTNKVGNAVDYFNPESGSPNMVILGDALLGPNNGEIRYPDWKTIFDDEMAKAEYKYWEICEFHIAIGTQYTIGVNHFRNIHGYAKYSREEFYKEDEIIEGSTLVPPEEGVGWEWTSKFDGGKRLWVRKPFNGSYSNSDWTIGTTQYNGTVQLGTATVKYSEYLSSKLVYPSGSNSQSIGTGVQFRDICRKIYRSTHESRLGKEVYSAFFWNDSPYMDFLDLEEGLNYYNMKPNFLNRIAVIHTSAIKQISDPDLEASQLKMSFKQLYDDLCVDYPSLVWFVDSDMNLHLEHERLIHRIRSYFDITGDVSLVIGDYKSYTFNNDKLFGNIVRRNVNSYYKDFNRSEEIFPKITSNKRSKDSISESITLFISFDIRGAIENPGELGNGIILVAYDVTESGGNEIVYGTGQITGNSVVNGVMATSYLLKEFGNYVGTWHEGKVDGRITNYKFSQYCRVGDDIIIKGIVHENYLFTDIGIALIKQKEYDFDNENTKCTPVYRHIDFYLSSGENEVFQFEADVPDHLTD